MRVLFFGRLREEMGSPAWELPADAAVSTVADLRALIAKQSTDFGKRVSHPSVRVAVDQQFATDATSLVGAKEVAFMPPLSGG